jgi:hypothetical protein
MSANWQSQVIPSFSINNYWNKRGFPIKSVEGSFLLDEGGLFHDPQEGA